MGGFLFGRTVIEVFAIFKMQTWRTEMVRSTRTRSGKLSELMNLIDPEGTLTPGSVAHEIVAETTSSWIEELGPEEAEKMVRGSLEHLQSQVKMMDMLG